LRDEQRYEAIAVVEADERLVVELPEVDLAPAVADRAD